MPPAFPRSRWLLPLGLLLLSITWGYTWVLGEDFQQGEVMGILLIGVGLALLSLSGWAASRREG